MQKFIFKYKLNYSLYLKYFHSRTLCFAEKEGQVTENGAVVWI